MYEDVYIHVAFLLAHASHPKYQSITLFRTCKPLNPALGLQYADVVYGGAG